MPAAVRATSIASWTAASAARSPRRSRQRRGCSACGGERWGCARTGNSELMNTDSDDWSLGLSTCSKPYLLAKSGCCKPRCGFPRTTAWRRGCGAGTWNSSCAMATIGTPWKPLRRWQARALLLSNPQPSLLQFHRSFSLSVGWEQIPRSPWLVQPPNFYLEETSVWSLVQAPHFFGVLAFQVNRKSYCSWWSPWRFIPTSHCSARITASAAAPSASSTRGTCRLWTSIPVV